MIEKIGEIDLAIVLGSGLAQLLDSEPGFDRVPYGELGIPVATLAGHSAHALVGRLHGKRVLAFAGRVHAYQGFDARDVTRAVHLAADSGAKTLLLTNAAGAVNPAYRPGDVMVIADHINLTGLNPLHGSGLSNPFVNMTGAYAPRLRALARAFDDALREGIYAGMLGPTYETPAEARFLRKIGADAVGMSTVLETIAARARGLEVFAASVITNVVAAAEATHDEVTAAANSAAPRLAALLSHLVERA